MGVSHALTLSLMSVAMNLVGLFDAVDASDVKALLCSD